MNFHIIVQNTPNSCIKLKNYELININLIQKHYKSGMVITYLHFTQFLKYDAFSDLALSIWIYQRKGRVMLNQILKQSKTKL